MQRGEFVDPRAGRSRFREFAQVWLDAGVDWKPLTRSRYDNVLKVHVLPAFGNAQVGTLDRPEVQRYIASLVEAGASPGSVRKVYAVLKMVLDVAVDAKAIKANPAVGVRLPRAQRRRMLVLEAAEVTSLARELREPYGLLVTLAAWSGLRAGEIAALRVGDLDLARGSVRDRTRSPICGHLHRGSTKNHREANVALPRGLCDDLAAFLASRRGGPAPHDAALFTGPGGGPFRHGNFYSRHFKPAVERALPEHLHGLRFHDLRHTCASLLIAQGWHPKAVSEQLRHASIAITMDLYGHLLASYSQQLVERLDAAYDDARRAAPIGAGVLPMRSAADPGRPQQTPIRPRTLAQRLALARTLAHCPSELERRCDLRVCDVRRVGFWEPGAGVEPAAFALQARASPARAVAPARLLCPWPGAIKLRLCARTTDNAWSRRVR